MQQRIAKEPKYIKGKNYRIRELKSGELQIEIRSTEYGYETKRLPVGTKTHDAHIHARNMLNEMASVDVPELARKVLKKFTLNDLIEAYLKTTSLSPRQQRNISFFQKHETALCSKTLNQHHMIVTGLEDHINRRKKEVNISYSITRTLSPLRAMYSNAGKQRLYGLIENKIKIATPFDEIDLPTDTSGREQCLKPFEELKILKAIDEQCKSFIQRLKWMALVNMALVTCLRKGVLMRLKWRDVDFDNKWIKVSKSYWGTGKRAPEYVPITRKLAEILIKYYINLSDKDKTPDVCLFESMRRRHNRRNNIDKTIDRNNWVETGFHDIIRRTDLWEPKKTPDGETMYDEKGIMERDWFCFHDLRHTAESRYAVKPYGLFPHEYGYLMGHLGDETKIQKKYNHSQKEFCEEIREKIDKGDTILARTLQKPGGDIPSPHEMAFNAYFIKGVQEGVQKLLKSERDSLRQRHGSDYVTQLEEFVKHKLETLPDTEMWLEEKTKADEFNQPRDDYRRKYDVYPEDDTVMQVWEASKGTATVNEDRASSYLRCITNNIHYDKEQELAEHFGIRPKKG